MRSHYPRITNTLGDYIQVNSQFIPDVLISPEILINIIEIGDYFDSAIAPVFGFECSLNNSLATADFFFCIRHLSRKKNILDSSNDSLVDNFIWETINSFNQQWSMPNTFMSQKIKDFWLEFDLENYNKKVPIPSIFFDAVNIDSQVQWQYILDKLLQLLLEKPIDDSTKKQFSKCIQALPKKVSAFQVGILLSRNNQNLRLYTTAISLSQIYHYLSQLNWQGDIDLLKNILNRVSGLVDKYQLQLEISNEISSTIAIEFYCYKQQNLHILLDYLTTTGFCLPEKWNALLNFSSSNNDFSRRIAYLKMTYTPGNSLQFKAYLGITPNPSYF